MRVALSCFFFNDTAPPELYTLSLHDALPIYQPSQPDRLTRSFGQPVAAGLDLGQRALDLGQQRLVDRKSTRLNSSHSSISYAVFCLKKKKKTTNNKKTYHTTV